MYHATCFTCTECKRVIGDDENFAAFKEGPCCVNCLPDTKDDVAGDDECWFFFLFHLLPVREKSIEIFLLLLLSALNRYSLHFLALDSLFIFNFSFCFEFGNVNNVSEWVRCVHSRLSRASKVCQRLERLIKYKSVLIPVPRSSILVSRIKNSNPQTKWERWRFID